MCAVSAQTGTGLFLALASISLLGLTTGCDPESTCLGNLCDDRKPTSGKQDSGDAGGGDAGTGTDARTAGTDGGTTAEEGGTEAGPGALEMCRDVQRPVLAACFQGPGVNDQGGSTYDDPLKIDVEVKVVATGKGAPPDPCFGYAGPGAIGQLGAYIDGAGRLTEARWATLEQANGARFTLGALAPGERPFDLAVGDDIEVSLSYRFGGFTPIYASLTVRDGQSGALRYWFGQGDAADTLEPPQELSFKLGDAICEDSNDCIDSFVRRGMVVEVAGQRAELPYAGRVDLDDLRIVSGGVEEQTGPGRCADAFVAWSAAAAWPRP